MISANCPHDGVTDASACIQAAINQTPSYDTCYLQVPNGVYALAAPLTINRPMRFIGQKAFVKMLNPNLPALKIMSKDVDVINLGVVGNQFAVQRGLEVGIQVVGPSAAAPLNNIRLLDCSVSNFGMYGILAQYVTNLLIQECSISNINYGGISCQSVIGGLIEANVIQNIIGTPNAYGIAITRQNINPLDLASDPLSQNITVSRNLVNGVPNWEGLDTHGGVGILFTENIVKNCLKGINIGPCNNSSQTSTYPPIDCLAIGNILDSGKTDGTAQYGIALVGAINTLAQTTGLAEGCVIQGNTIRNFGQSSNNLGMAVYLEGTRGAVCNGNVIVNPGKMGIGFYLGNYGFNVSDNAIMDPWSGTQICVAINVISQYNRGVIASNSFVRGLLAAAHVLDIGINVATGTNNYIVYTPGYNDATTKLSGPVFAN
jgi:hypothetical protein